MPKLTRREFLLSLAALPALKLALPSLELLPAAHRLSGPASQSAADQPNFLVVVFDALSAQHIPTFGYQRDTMPNLTRLAEKATVFNQHYASANFTTAGTASLLTGLYPWTHRAIQYYGHTRWSVADNNIFRLLPDEYYKVAYTHNPLASALLHQFQDGIDQLEARHKHALTDGLWSDVMFANDFPVSIYAERVITGLHSRPPSAPYLQFLNLLRFRSESEKYEKAFAEQFPRSLPDAEFDALFRLEDVTDWLSQLTTTVTTPYFMYVHMFPPHAPYNTRADFVDIFNDGWQPVQKATNPMEAENVGLQRMLDARRYYDEFIAYVDAEFGRLYDQLEKSGALDNTYLILTADHGELFERGIVGHGGTSMYDGVTHVPLMVWKPGQQERVDVHQRTSAVDLVPTLLYLTGRPTPDLCEGTVLPTFSDAADQSDRSIFALEAKLNNSFAPLTVGTTAFYHGPHKLIHYMGYENSPSDEGYYELFDLANDPEELENLIDSDKTAARDMKEQLAQKIDEVNQPFRRA